MRNRLSPRLVVSVLSVCWATTAYAGGPGLSPGEKAAIIASLNNTLETHYAFPDMARKIAPVLRQHLEKGDYDLATTKEAFAARLTEDLLKTSGDLHFFVGVDKEWVSEFRANGDPAVESRMQKEELARMEKANFGFDEVRRLDGNIGYIRFGYFADPQLAYETATSAMRFVGNTDAVIIDLRYNNGGYLEMAQFIASYFFSTKKDQLIFDYYYNQDGKRIERGQWVLPGLPGKRMVDKPVYILTSTTSFSSAEWFSYAMKKLGRATLVGERTAGGAHPVERQPVNDEFFVQVPIGQIKDPVDHGDFEGAGVQPDIQSPSTQALSVAHKLALENLAKTSDAGRTEFAWLLPALAANIKRPVVDSGMIQKAVGKYQGRQIVRENGTLFCIWRNRFRVALEPIESNLFAVEGVSDFRYRLQLQNGKVVSLERVNKDGSIQAYQRLD